MRRRILGLAMTILATAPLVSSRAQAQDHRLSFTGYLGGAGYSNLAGELDPGLMLGSSGFYGGMAELWFGRLGLRLHAGTGSPSLQDDPATGFDIMAGDIDLVARFRRPRADLFFQPYGVIGLGALRYDLSPDATSVGGFDYEADPSTRGTLVLAIGTDLGRGPVAVRLEMMNLVGWSSPLSQSDGVPFEPVSHVVFTFGLSFRAGTIDLPPPPPVRPPVTRTRPEEPREPTRTTPRQPTRDTTTTRDTLRHLPRVPDIPERTPGAPTTDTATVDTTAADTTPMAPQAPDTTRTAPPPQDTTTGPEPPGEPADTTDAGDGGRGRLFTVRVTWDPTDAAQLDRVTALMVVLKAANVPLWPPEPDPDAMAFHRRAAALTNAADARLLGNHVQEVYDLAWEWVHIDKDEDVPQADVEASTAFVDALREQGKRPGLPGGPPAGGGPPK